MHALLGEVTDEIASQVETLAQQRCETRTQAQFPGVKHGRRALTRPSRPLSRALHQRSQCAHLRAHALGCRPHKWFVFRAGLVDEGAAMAAADPRLVEARHRARVVPRTSGFYGRDDEVLPRGVAEWGRLRVPWGLVCGARTCSIARGRITSTATLTTGSTGCFEKATGRRRRWRCAEPLVREMVAD